jgi:uncharacterized membrane protein YkvA (DUF1232 family)
MNEKKPNGMITAPDGGVVRNMLNQIKLIFRLMGDSRVNIFAKLVPIGALAYLFSPDPVMLPIIGVVDDAALLWLGSYVFTELCPPAVVAEHMKELAGNMEVSANEEIVEAEATEIKE